MYEEAFLLDVLCYLLSSGVLYTLFLLPVLQGLERILCPHCLFYAPAGARCKEARL